MSLANASQANNNTELTIKQLLGQKLMLDLRYFCEDDNSQQCRTPVTRLPAPLKSLIQRYNIGGVILFSENVQHIEQIVSLTNELQNAVSQSASKLPLFIAIDQEGGRVARINREQATSFTGNMSIGATYPKHGVKYAAQSAAVIAKELEALGINVNFAPTVDVNSNPENPVINVRSFSEDPKVVTKLGEAQVRAFTQNGVIPALKHFPGHGDTHVDSHTGLPRVDHSLSQIQQQDLLPFSEIIKATEVTMVMTAHIQYPALDNSQVINSQGETMLRPATMSYKIMTELLREQLGFKGVTITDALDMAGISDFFSSLDATIETFNAGVDIALMPMAIRTEKDIEKFAKFMEGLEQAVATKKLDVQQLKESSQRILALKSNQLQNKTTTSVAIAQSLLGNPAHRKLEAELALAAITEVKNQGTLPLNKGIKRVHLIMPDKQKCEALSQALVKLNSQLNVSCTSLQAFEPTLAEQAINQADMVIGAHASPPQSAVEIGGMEDVKKLTDFAVDKNQQPNALKKLLASAKALNKPSVFISLRAPYEITDFSPFSDAVLASYAYNVDVSNEHEVSGPAYTALAKVLLGYARAEGTLPVTVKTNQ
ncbi:glycoside hydrolase family 3 N-terminal domain-containing protein (plasmid) [Pseudoalteromonas sp. T1lg65]|uniref:glycoside hydrolase family 3 protein n=1 Tax=Pseudoalteromonas sp. T1lg65 TaxID=2077101 RepID=UPI003F78DB09